MLILTRYSAWSRPAPGRDAIRVIMGGETLLITVVETQGDKVSLGFEAPKSIKVWREDVWQRVEAERQA